MYKALMRPSEAKDVLRRQKGFQQSQRKNNFT